MKHLPRIVIALALFLSVFTWPTAARSTQAARKQVTVGNGGGPIFIQPNDTLTPPIVVKQGLVLTVLEVEGDWFHVEFADPQWGRRVGYIQKKSLVTTPQATLREHPTVAAAGATDDKRPHRVIGRGNVFGFDLGLGFWFCRGGCRNGTPQQRQVMGPKRNSALHFDPKTSPNP
jgi:hypothetical protein